jgi:acid phosphatase
MGPALRPAVKTRSYAADLRCRWRVIVGFVVIDGAGRAIRMLSAVLLSAAVAAGSGSCAAGAPAGTRAGAPAGSPASSPATPSGTSPGAPSGTSPGGSPAGGLPRPAHVLVAVFENRSYPSVAGNPKAPYLGGLLARSAVFTDAHGVTHPSQPNYLALFSGSTHGVTNDRCPVDLAGRPNLARQLIDAGLGFTGYSEDLPAAGFRGCSYAGYARKHNPWVDFDNVPASANQPYAAFPADLGTLPTVSFVVPNLCNDMHDCGTAAGDRWASVHLDGYLRWADTHDSLLIVTFDENDGSAGNRILTLFAGPMVRPGRYGQTITHYTVLRTVEAMYGLPPIGEAAGTAPITYAWGV